VPSKFVNFTKMFFKIWKLCHPLHPDL
jgi:hypothetical protein